MRKSTMRHHRLRLLALGLGLGATGLVLFSHTSARAQAIDVSPPAPNVLILLDSSGSMEKMIDFKDPELNATYGSLTSACNPGSPSEPNRWGYAVQALTGDFQPYYSCVSTPRTAGSNFVKEYSITVGGTTYTPYDTDYYLPYHRPLANQTCAFAPFRLPGVVSAGDGVGTSGFGAGPLGVLASTARADQWIDDGVGAWTIDTASAGGPAVTVNKASTPQCSFTQARNGFIDSGRDMVRFGLMTFDHDPGWGTGVRRTGTTLEVSPAYLPTSPGIAPAPTNNPFDGMWSYYRDWDTDATAANAGRGRPPNCALSQFDVGARNAAAPPWEGRLFKFPGSTSTVREMQRHNDRVELLINAMRPYGATPIAGMLADAQTYFWDDPTGPEATDPYVNPVLAGGAASDPGCREQFIVLFTDGAPNLDMRPACQNSGSPNGQCPYKRAEQIAEELNRGQDVYGGSHTNMQPVTTLVIGFAVSGTTAATEYPAAYTGPKNCSSFALDPNFMAGTNLCASVAPGTAGEACCNLEKIARAGQWTPTSAHPTSTGPCKDGSGNDIPCAYFADSIGSLKQALSNILGRIAGQVTSRAAPAFGAASGSATGTSVESFTTAFVPNSQGVWNGNILRRRYTCNASFVPTTNPITTSQGDNFLENMRTASSPRRFIAIQPATVSGQVDAQNTIRPFYPAADPDGTGAYGGVEQGTTYSALLAGITPAALNIDDNTCKASKGVSALTAAKCQQVALSFLTGETSPFPSGYGYSPPTERALTSSGFPLGGIFHASPAVVPPPLAPVSDASYLRFSDTYKTRKNMVYAVSTDGLLHGFYAGAALTTQEQNETFAFVPPAVMPRLLYNYPGGQQNLLDGSPVVADVPLRRTRSSYGAGWENMWRTVLVAGMGRAGGGGYYALDVTRGDAAWTATPSTSTYPPPTNDSAHFLWQITTVPDTGTPGTGHFVRKDNMGVRQMALFGNETGTPALTTIFADVDGDGVPEEVAVAILPGGIDGPPKGQGGDCPRAYGTMGYAALGSTPATNLTTANSWYEYTPTVGHTARTRVRKWARTCNDTVPGRSVVIVRVDTGEILKVFARKRPSPTQPAEHEVPARLDARTSDTPLDSPMVGTPVVWPQGTGVVAQKFFIGDADGTIWKFDISSPNMANWKGGMFYDMYNTEVVDADFGKTFTAAELAEASQPVEVAPLLSLDQNGNLVIHAATGDLENFASKKFLAADLDDADPDDRDDEANKVPIYNYLIAIREIPQVDQSGARVYRAYNYNAAGSYTAFNTWRHAMTNGERVSGPMVVFDRTIYYATWAPAANLICGANGGESRIYGRDYLAIPSVAPIPAPCSAGQAHCGGQVKLASAYITAQSIDPLAAGKLVPGLALQASPACADTQTQTDYYTGNSYTSMTSYTPSKYSIFASVGTAAPSGPGPLTINVNVPQPNTTVRLSSWAAVID